ncbi:hypothetical protein PYW07_011587 [Mythimna separata]|uniref:Uncharacterized protein n=1 Tax=Mythimna separata TaxID=271217 RepID=A0AAD7Y6Q5_MYTSE|nr:hypothetical protein PYW07_011587 [Mythimna separata]
MKKKENSYFSRQNIRTCKCGFHLQDGPRELAARRVPPVHPLDAPRSRKLSEVARRATPVPAAPAPRGSEHAPEEDMSLDLSQVSDFEDTLSKYGVNKFATSTPLPTPATSATPPTGRAPPRCRASCTLSAWRRGARSSTASPAAGTPPSLILLLVRAVLTGTAELDYSSVSPEYSGQSSADLSPRTLPTRASQQTLSPRSQDLQLSRLMVSKFSLGEEIGRNQFQLFHRQLLHDRAAAVGGTWAECSDAGVPRAAAADALNGEWCAFWANNNNSLPSAPVKRFYNRCPTPYCADGVDPADWEFADVSRKRSPEDMEAINNIIRTQGLHLTPRETQNVIKCAHLLGSVLTRAMDRRVSSDDPELTSKKKTMTLPLKETSIPLEVKEEKKCETATTQTDISLPNTKSTPRIFENILRQRSRSSIDVDKIKLNNGFI